MDWRDSGGYAPLLGADRSLFAWEWLRRDPRYAEAATAALTARDRSRTADRFESLDLRIAPCFSLQGIAAAERPFLTLRRFLALCRGGRFSRTLHPGEPRARR